MCADDLVIFNDEKRYRRRRRRRAPHGRLLLLLLLLQLLLLHLTRSKAKYKLEASRKIPKAFGVF